MSTAAAAGVRDTFGRPLRDLRISVIDRCNFRCPYCMPKDTYGDDYQFLPQDDYLTFTEVERLVRLFVTHGVSKVRLTGGEPLLRPGLAELVAALARIPGIDDLALTTNGYLLAEHAPALRAAGLNRVTVSLDSVDPATFAQMNGLGIPIDRVLAGIRRAQEVGLAPVKFNAVVQRGINDHTVLDLVDAFADQEVAIRFIEYMDVGNLNGWDPGHGGVEHAELQGGHRAAHYPLQPVGCRLPRRGGPALPPDRPRRPKSASCRPSVSRSAATAAAPACPPTAPFTPACSLGAAPICAHRCAPARSDHELAELIGSVWRGRTDRYSEERAEVTAFERTRERKIEMYPIGALTAVAERKI